MAQDKAARLLPGTQGERRASYLELFFDLSFIFALSQLSRNLQRDLSLGGAARTMLLLAAIWWVWLATSWAADWHNAGRARVREVLIAVTLAELLMAAAVPQAFGAHAAWFAGGYLTIHLGSSVAVTLGLRGHPLQWRSLRIAIWFFLTGILWFLGTIIRSAQEPLWAIAVTVDFAVARLRWPLPRLGRSTWTELGVTGSHLAERYEQIFIVAIGALILDISVAFSADGFSATRMVAFLLAFAQTALMAGIYVVPGEGRLGSVIGASQNSGRTALQIGYLHFLLVTSIMVTAVGDEQIVAKPHGPGRAAVVAVAVAGTTLFLAGQVLVSVWVRRRPSWFALIGVIAMAALIPVMLHLPPVFVVAVTDGVLLVNLINRAWEQRRRLPPAWP